jgi:glycosyltransferase involved in cell wall biosynthesis
MKTQPLITVGIPARPTNIGYFQQSLESVTNQSYGNIEILVADDATQTLDIEQEIARVADPRIRYHRHKTQIGLAANFTWCVRHARGEWVNIFHDDDVMLQANVENMVLAAQLHPEHHFQFSQVQSVDAEGAALKGPEWFTMQLDSDRVYPGAVLRDYLFSRFQNRLCMPSVFVRRDHFLQHIPFSPRPTFTTDLNMWLRILNSKGIKFLIRSDTGIQYRFHSKQATATLISNVQDCLVVEFARVFCSVSHHDQITYIKRVARRLVGSPRQSVMGVLSVLRPAQFVR